MTLIVNIFVTKFVYNEKNTYQQRKHDMLIECILNYFEDKRDNELVYELNVVNSEFSIDCRVRC